MAPKKAKIQICLCALSPKNLLERHGNQALGESCGGLFVQSCSPAKRSHRFVGYEAQTRRAQTKMIGSAFAAANTAASIKPISHHHKEDQEDSSSRHRSALNRVCADAPENYGLLITFESGCEGDNICRMEFVPDEHLDSIHPNAYGPASLTELQVLGGGGSGVRVFKGSDPVLGSLVMKHGGYRDTKELFALATIAQELQRRDSCNQQNSPCANMLSRIPEFKMIYISPRHLTDKPKELWGTVYKAISSIMFSNDVSDTSSRGDGSMESSTHSGSSEGSDEGGLRGKQICLYTSGSKDQVKIEYHSHNVDFILGSDDKVEDHSIDNEPFGFSIRYGATGNAYPCLKAFLDALIPKQKKNLWKFTQGQRTIGGSSPTTGFSYLAKGQLHGDLLDTLISEYLCVIRNLQKLTLPSENDIVEKVQKEVDTIENDVFARPCDVSDDLDAFVGFALKKNFHAEKGRFFVLRRMGKSFRSKKYILTQPEKLPGRLLGKILKTGALMSDVFQDAPHVTSALDFESSTKGKWDAWRVMLRDAVNLKSDAAMKRVWTCGIADGGLHNLFLSSDKMWLFDMGEPTLQPLPAFLTKFMFSFFHSLGMVDDQVRGGWVNRFVPGDKAALTEETQMLVPKTYDAFKIAMDRMIVDLFDGEEAVRGLLIKYVTFQLFSDAAFCLNKWSVKGGGRSRGTNHQKNLEKWLWRALWDIYIASDLNTTKCLRQVGIKLNTMASAVNTKKGAALRGPSC